jgi:hypothetical protein
MDDPRAGGLERIWAIAGACRTGGGRILRNKFYSKQLEKNGKP